MARKNRAQQVAESLSAAVGNSNLYRNIAERLAAGKWHDVDIALSVVEIEKTIIGLIEPDDDYVLVGPVVYAAIRRFEGYVDGDMEDDIISNNVFGWMDNGIEVRVYSSLPAGKLVIGRTPVSSPDHRIKKKKLKNPKVELFTLETGELSEIRKE